MNEIINALVNDSPAYVILAYLIYKDWKNSDTVTKALARIDLTLDRLCKQLSKRSDNV